MIVNRNSWIYCEYDPNVKARNTFVGLFDYVICKMPLADGSPFPEPTHKCQTKDFRPSSGTLSTFLIKEDGTIELLDFGEFIEDNQERDSKIADQIKNVTTLDLLGDDLSYKAIVENGAVKSIVSYNRSKSE